MHAKDVFAKLSEIQSMRAIAHTLAVYLEMNYKGSDAGDAEMRITRDDNAIVPEPHIDLFVEKLYQQLEELDAELEEWGSMELQDMADNIRRITVGEDAVAPVSKKKGKRRVVEDESDLGRDSRDPADQTGTG